MTFVATAIGLGAGAAGVGGLTLATGGALGAAVGGALASQKAAGTQAAAIRAGQNAQERMFNKQTELQEPFRQAGLTSQNRLMDLLGLSDRTGAAGYGSAATPFSMTNYQADPGYAFRLQEGLKALDRTAAARGGMLGGNQLRGAVEYGQNLGSQEYQNAFNRYYTERANLLNPLQSLMGAGQTSANTLTNAAGQYGQQQAESAANLGNLRASGYMGAANAVSGGLGQYLNYQQGQNTLAALRGYGNTGGTGYTSAADYGNYTAPNYSLGGSLGGNY